jgi:hypothetical protein
VAQLSATLLPAAQVGVAVALHDVSEPLPERLPEFAGTCLDGPYLILTDQELLTD